MPSFWLHGANGRMGRAIQDIAAERPEVVVTPLDLRVEKPAGTGGSIQAIIDFSLPAGLIEVAGFAARHGLPLVSGTTGSSPAMDSALAAAARSVPVVHATNFSVGLAAMRQAAALLATRLDWDCELVETHHGGKRDAPSGTALTLVECVNQARGLPNTWVDRMAGVGAASPRQPGSIGVSSLRGGTVVGDHTLHWFGEAERISLAHHAEDRRIFARGALLAAQRLIGQPAGRYSLEEVLWPAADEATSS